MTTPLQQRRRVEAARARAWFAVVLGALSISIPVLMLISSASWKGLWGQLGLGVVLAITGIVALKKNPRPQGPDPAPQRAPTPDRSPGESENV
ncbi:hypothetical protein ALI44B_05490 [Leifsonia sp. ALI-44-B]|uniref:hypothetical protein n=1 Tax=Leifsonia sp. ALI-44-B TaxID=1933776 RepID=UPI00097C86EC|nr:hypothetical protein [Leifsonia sp. ALI-44-B]ONI64044.1 hypothetical protein ALI44B_05490 [Leifsonia sp. ALI-44-B]